MGYEFITKHTSPNSTQHKNRKIDTIVIHHWGVDKQKFDNVVRFLCTPWAQRKPQRKSSAHFVVESGKVACIVNVNDVAWHANNWDMNKRSIGIECRPEKSSGDLETVCELVADLFQLHGVLRVIGHKDVSATACPGRYYSELNYIKARAIEIVQERNATPPAKPETAKYHTVKKNESLSVIAKKYKTTVDKLVKLNNIKNKDLIFVNQKIRVK